MGAVLCHFSNVDIVPIALGEGGGEWTMANQLYVKSGESPWLLHVTLAGWKVGVKISLKWFPCLVLTNSCMKLV